MVERYVLAVTGEPVAQGRPRGHYVRGLGVRMYEDEASTTWKRVAAATMRVAMGRAKLPMPLYPEGPLEFHVLALFECPRSHHRKREPVPRRPHTSAPDVDNLAKAALDAGKGLLWHDDGQVVRLVSEKLYAAQGEPARVLLMVRPLPLEGWAQLRRLESLQAPAQADVEGADEAAAAAAGPELCPTCGHERAAYRGQNSYSRVQRGCTDAFHSELDSAASS